MSVFMTRLLTPSDYKFIPFRLCVGTTWFSGTNWRTSSDRWGRKQTHILFSPFYGKYSNLNWIWVSSISSLWPNLHYLQVASRRNEVLWAACQLIGPAVREQAVLKPIKRPFLPKRRGWYDVPELTRHLHHITVMSAEARRENPATLI